MGSCSMFSTGFGLVLGLSTRRSYERLWQDRGVACEVRVMTSGSESLGESDHVAFASTRSAVSAQQSVTASYTSLDYLFVYVFALLVDGPARPHRARLLPPCGLAEFFPAPGSSSFRLLV
jgi:hypothetical protein